MRNVITYTMVFVAISLNAQLHSDKPVQFMAADSSERQIENLAYPLGSDHAANAYSIQSGQMTFDVTTQLNVISVTMNPPLTAYVEGTRLNIRVDTNNSGAVTLDVDGLGPVPVVKGVDGSLDSNDIVMNEVISVIHDGTNFQLVAAMHNECPLGFVQVNAEYCIEIDEHPDAHFWGALEGCKALNATLCNYPDWLYACNNAGLGLNDMIGNYEWVGDAYDHSYTGTKVGETDCLDMTFQYAYVTGGYEIPYRCCYYIKR